MDIFWNHTFEKNCENKDDIFAKFKPLSLFFAEIAKLKLCELSTREI